MAATKVPSHLTEGLAKDDLSNVDAATGRAALGAVSADCDDSLGSFVWAAPANPVAAGATFKNYGETVAGSLLVPAGQTGNTQPRSSTTLTGTYRCLGYAHNDAGAEGYPATLYQKISMT